jgi:hypothetical protein
MKVVIFEKNVGLLDTLCLERYKISIQSFISVLLGTGSVCIYAPKG